MGSGNTTEPEPEEAHEVQEVSCTSPKRKVGSLRVSTDWRSKSEEAESPSLTVDHLLRHTDQKIDYTSEPPPPTVEKIPVPAGYVIR